MKKVSIILLLCAFWPLVTLAQATLQKPFTDCGLHGSTTIYDYHNDRWIFTDSADARRATLPASTFKIINSLIALETGVVKDEHEVLPWDGVKRDVAAWNASTDMAQAFKNSTVWFYVKLAEKVGKDKYKTYLRKSAYGNSNISTGLGADFWNYGAFGVTPVNQIEFLVRLYQEKLPFSKNTFVKVKDLMIEEENAAYVLRGKTGWTRADGQDIGWWVGYLEKDGNVYFFATRLTKPNASINPNFAACRRDVTKAVFRTLGILP